MSNLLSNTVQPPLLTLLSSTSHPSLSPLFTTHTDPLHPSSSIITSISDTLIRPRTAKRKWDAEPDERSYIPVHPTTRGDIMDEVIHIQGPRMGLTYIQAGSSSTISSKTSGKNKNEDLPLGVELPWVHFQVKRLGRRELAVEVGVVDLKGREGIVRCSSFQKTPSIHPYRNPPLIHLPLSLADQTSSTMTQWLDISLSMISILPLFQSLPRAKEGKRTKREMDMPNSQFGSMSYVKVYANCRIRRIWFSESGQSTMRNIDLKEFALRAAAPPGST